MTVLRGQRMQRYALSAINLGFLALILHGLVAYVVLAILVFHVMLRLIRGEAWPRAVTAIASVLLLALFVLNKSGVANLPGMPHGVPVVLTAVGFSFLALRAIEVVRANFERRHAPPDFVALVNYLIPFHMLAAGPIQAYDDFCRPSQPAPIDKEVVLSGTEAIASGLFKKFVLAFAVQSIFLNDFNSNGVQLLFESMAFLLWLYLDFSAYSNIALGIGILAGIPTPENFRNPLMARNLVDFWDRWHISLSLFIRRNIFIPIQLSLMRHSSRPNPVLVASVATGVSFLLCGLWHGLSWGWFVWGALHAAGLIGVRLYGVALARFCNPQQIAAYRQSRVAGGAAMLLTYMYVSAAFLPVFLIGKA